MQSEETTHRRDSRVLSSLDWRTFKGTLPLPPRFSNESLMALQEEDPSPGDALYRVPNVPPAHWTVLHIPKTAGDSVMSESPFHMPVGSKLKGNKEKTLQGTEDKRHRLVVFLREPTGHVLSQFLECKYDGWGKNKTYGLDFPGYYELDDVLAGFDAWIDHFRTAKKQGKYGHMVAYRCYDPFNMQARHLASKQKDGHVANSYNNRFPDADQAIQNLRQNITVLGIVENYPASICLFELYAGGGNFLSPECQICEDGKLALLSSDKIIHESHNVPKHSLSMITNTTTMDFIRNNMTRADQELYRVAKDLFMAEVDRIHIETGHDLLCRQGFGQSQHGAEGADYSEEDALKPIFTLGLEVPSPWGFPVVTFMTGILIWGLWLRRRRSRNDFTLLSATDIESDDFGRS